MTSKPHTPPGLLWLALAGLAVGLGAGPLLAAMLPLSPWTAAAVLFGAGPLAWWSLSGESRVARLDVEQARSPFSLVRIVGLVVAALVATLAAAVASVHAAWGAVALVRLAEDGPASVSEQGLSTWMGSDQGFLGSPGLQGSTGLLLALAGVVLVAALLARGRWRGAALGLLGLTLVIQAACGAVLWIDRGAPAMAAVNLHEAWPGAKVGLGEIAIGVFAGLLLSGAGFGTLHALLRAEGATSGCSRRLRLVAPAAALLGLLAAWPAAVTLPGAPLGAPAPFGRIASVALLMPASELGTMGWQAAWFAGVLAAGLLGVLVASQAALRVLDGALGVKPAGASAALAGLLGLAGVLAVILPGVLETLFACLGMLLTLMAAAWAFVDRPAGLRRWLVAFLLCLPCLALFRYGLALVRPTQGTWRDHALTENAVLALLLVGALGLWWLALALVAAVRAHRAGPELRPPGPGGPGPRRTRA
jgi:hypothetical protein